jgi:hypothetical protein
VNKVVNLTLPFCNSHQAKYSRIKGELSREMCRISCAG